MSKKELPAVGDYVADRRFAFQAPQRALEAWSRDVFMLEEEANSINIMDLIGEDFWTGEGVTPSWIQEKLARLGGADVVVNINSPGGNFFDGISIYNQFRQYPGRVTMKVHGVAASAASVIAMAHDELLIGDAAFLMIHNSWGCICGDRHELAAASKAWEPFDNAMAELYSNCSTLGLDEISAMMDRETYITAKDAVEWEFADGIIPAGTIGKGESVDDDVVAAHKIDNIMQRAGLSRTERRALLKSVKSGKPSAAVADEVMHAADQNTMRAAGDVSNALSGLRKALSEI